MQTISSKNTQFYPSIIQDYLEGKLHSIANIAHGLNWAELQAKKEIKKASYKYRTILVEVLLKQYQDFPLVEEVKNNIDLLLNEEVFTITTGHQLSLFGGPMFFFTKILELVKYCEEAKNYNLQLVPVFWMATEDHDFEEIAKVNVFNQTIQWQQNLGGAVGRLSVESLQEIKNQLISVLGNQQQIIECIDKSFMPQYTLAKATKMLVHLLLGKYGVVVLDGDDAQLKSLFVPVATREILEDNLVKKQMEEQADFLQNYKLIVTPREVNLFYVREHFRERLIKNNDGSWQTVNADYKWNNSNELINELNQFPQCVSPNVTLRPVYQEIILPNLAYVGGAGEISYWLQLPKVFKVLNIPFPLPIVRSSFVILNAKAIAKVQHFNLSLEDLFLSQDLLFNLFIAKNASGEINLEHEYNEINTLFKSLLDKGKKIHNDLDKVVLGEEKRVLAVIENIEKRFRNAEKRNQEDNLKQLANIQEKVFPNGSFQERYYSAFNFTNSISWNDFTELLLQNMQCFNNDIKLIQL